MYCKCCQTPKQQLKDLRTSWIDNFSVPLLQLNAVQIKREDLHREMAAALTGEVKQTSFKQAFAVFDRDQTGEIDSGDFPTAVRSLGYNPTNSQVEDVLKAANKSGKDKINFEEFADMLAKFDASSKDDAEESLREAFK